MPCQVPPSLKTCPADVLGSLLVLLMSSSPKAGFEDWENKD